MAITQRPGGQGSSEITTQPPSRLYLTAFEHHVHQHLAQRARIGVHPLAGGHLVGQRDATARSAAGRISARVLSRKGASSSACGCIAVRPSSTRLQVQHLVDQPEQVLAGAQHVVGVLDHLGRPAVGLHLQQLREADDGVQRRAHLVAHAREELALRPVGQLGRLLVEQGLLGLLQSRDVEVWMPMTRRGRPSARRSTILPRSSTEIQRPSRWRRRGSVRSPAGLPLRYRDRRKDRLAVIGMDAVRPSSATSRSPYSAWPRISFQLFEQQDLACLS